MPLKKILVVEDDKFLANAYRVGFEGEEYDVVIASDGEEAMDMVMKEKPDLILLDILIPKLSGFEVLERLQKDKDFKKIPVLIASNLGQQADIDRGLKLGAVDYIVKSDSSIKEILEKIAKILK